MNSYSDFSKSFPISLCWHLCIVPAGLGWTTRMPFIIYFISQNTFYCIFYLSWVTKHILEIRKQKWSTVLFSVMFTVSVHGAAGRLVTHTCCHLLKACLTDLKYQLHHLFSGLSLTSPSSGIRACFSSWVRAWFSPENSYDIKLKELRLVCPVDSSPCSWVLVYPYSPTSYPCSVSHWLPYSFQVLESDVNIAVLTQTL